jgi:hypothetical protein
MKRSSAPPGERFLFEFRKVGTQMRVAAIDDATGTEVVIVAPLTASQKQMQLTAAAKLRRRLAERDAKNGGPRPRSDGRPGRLA